MSQELNLIKKEDMSESAILNTENTTNPSDIKSISILNIETDKEELNKINKIFGNDVKEQNPFRLGNTYALYYFDGEPLIVIGPHWPFCIFLMGTIMTIGYFFFLYLWSFLDDILIFLGMCVFGFFIISYTITLLKNPGIPKRKYSILNLNPTILKNKKICLKCQIYSEHSKIVRHCFECNVCIKGHDHHCPWTSKCVGKGNLKAFYCFVTSIFLLFIYFILTACVISIRITNNK